MEMDNILNNCRNACGIADDIVIYGKTEEEHNDSLNKFLEVAKDEGLTSNSTKCFIKKSEISFFCNIYTNNGMKPDRKKN